MLYARSIRENIGYGVSGEVSMEEVKKVAQWSNAHEFVVKLPQQYNTETGEKGRIVIYRLRWVSIYVFL